MLLRYSSSIAVGALVTAALVYWMQLMIAGGDFELAKPVRVEFPPLIEFVPKPPVRRTPPPKPPVDATTRPTLPVSNDTITSLTTVRTGPVGPATPPGPPSPPVRPGGRQGPWMPDSNLMLRSPVQPIYPLQAIRRELEGYVIVEFTVTRLGSVTDVNVVESSHGVFEAAAAKAVAGSRYQPQVVDSVPVDVTGLRTRIEFVLGD